MALDVKKNILSAPLPDPNDDSAEVHRMRSLILAAADSTIEQTIRLRTNQLATNSHDDEIGKIFEERQRRAIKEIERLSEGAAVALTAAKSRH
jgi:hypothetical protein